MQVESMVAVYIMSYTEYESGWGSRPDGTIASFSEKVIQDHMLKIIGNRTSNHVPSSYSNPDHSKPIKVYVNADNLILKQLSDDKAIWVSKDEEKFLWSLR